MGDEYMIDLDYEHLPQSCPEWRRDEDENNHYKGKT